MVALRNTVLQTAIVELIIILQKLLPMCYFNGNSYTSLKYIETVVKSISTRKYPFMGKKIIIYLKLFFNT